MRKALLVAAFMLLTPAFLAAQTPKWTLGAGVLGLTYETESEVFLATIPGGGGNLGLSSVFIGFFPHDNVAIRPGVNFQLASNGGTAYDALIEAQVEYHFSGVGMASPYVFGLGQFNLFDAGDLSDSETDFAAGGGIGYRLLPFDFWALMFEVSYRRWFDFELNQVMGSVKMEVVFN
ncbi:MAG: hypothetical protein GWN99_11785 [Gemmatimonadetes bacterium]|uniref:Outer membrane protein beta-barrel domain-containing protein n=1 Tax=Candidatus Kutchimonas denitrificans TaxID=3056748 RepID=A0AAE4ZA82_9BACT|nr:hypothetical protein [Gemmatimonadota bacterium]NIR75412.1 hypothetical protein [Candidatus Kutchimonas denitrificans]NIS01726.1 hypothetical protein [Gemmatimonadota bacterium]NIT67508.1 hypothetical protein [Gemmatimonadota bacterium]NIU53371.1 hypothetical protein [Gemmatimonadota bacterium]